MSLNRWFSVILMIGLILALIPLVARADPPFEPRPYYHHPHGNAYGWDGPRGHGYGWDGPRGHGYDRHHKYFRRSCGGPHYPHYVDRGYGYAGPPPVAYVAPVAPVIGIPYSQPQPFYSQPGPPGLSGQVQLNF